MDILEYLESGCKILIDKNDGDFIINIIDNDFMVKEFYFENNPSEKDFIESIEVLVYGEQMKIKF